jgi:hypothetical protein
MNNINSSKAVMTAIRDADGPIAPIPQGLEKSRQTAVTAHDKFAPRDVVGYVS